MTPLEILRKNGYSLEYVANLLPNKNGGFGISPACLRQSLRGNTFVNRLRDVAKAMDMSFAEFVACMEEKCLDPRLVELLRSTDGTPQRSFCKVVKAHGTTLKEVAKKMPNNRGGIGLTLMSLSTTLKCNPNISKLRDLANVLGISLTQLIVETDAPRNAPIPKAEWTPAIALGLDPMVVDGIRSIPQITALPSDGKEFYHNSTAGVYVQ